VYACPATTLVAGVPVIVGGWLGVTGGGVTGGGVTGGGVTGGGVTGGSVTGGCTADDPLPDPPPHPVNANIRSPASAADAVV
jgi:hypothetical protein